jgi:hypothetical protein
MRETYGIDVKVLYIGEGVERKACFPSLSAFQAKVVGSLRSEEDR